MEDMRYLLHRDISPSENLVRPRVLSETHEHLADHSLPCSRHDSIQNRANWRE